MFKAKYLGSSPGCRYTRCEYTGITRGSEYVSRRLVTRITRSRSLNGIFFPPRRMELSILQCANSIPDMDDLVPWMGEAPPTELTPKPLPDGYPTDPWTLTNCNPSGSVYIPTPTDRSRAPTGLCGSFVCRSNTDQTEAGANHGGHAGQRQIHQLQSYSNSRGNNGSERNFRLHPAIAQRAPPPHPRHTVRQTGDNQMGHEPRPDWSPGVPQSVPAGGPRSHQRLDLGGVDQIPCLTLVDSLSCISSCALQLFGVPSDSR